VTLRRKSTLAWSLKHCGDIPSIRTALELPQVADILDTIDAHRAARFYILSVPQVFKTLLGQLRLMRSFQVEPADSLWYRESDKQIEAFADEKLNPLFDTCRPLPSLLFADKNKRAKMRMATPAPANFALLSAGVDGNRQSKTACDIYFDEPWLFGPGWVGDIQKRRASHPHGFREVYMTTGPTATTEADQTWQASDKRVWHCRCPACSRLFEPRRTHHDSTGQFSGGLVYETVLTPDGNPDEAAIAASTKYQCPTCRAVLPNSDSTRRAMSGTREKPRGIFVSTNPAAAPRTFGWHVHHIALRDWGELAVKMVKAELARTRAGDLTITEEVCRLYDADVWDPDKYHRPEKFAKYQHTTPYMMRDEWAEEVKDAQGRPFRSATVDVQLDYFVYVSRKWGKFSQSRLHYAHLCLSASEVALCAEKDGVPPERIFMDARHDTQRVRAICAQMGWRAMMGDKEMRDYMHDDGVRRIYDKPKVIDALTGTVLQGGGAGCVIEILFSKNAALDRLSLLRAADSKAPNGTPLWTAAENAPEWYFKQINAHYRKRVERPDGSAHYVWLGQKEDHAGDDEAMHVVVAAMAKLTGAESLRGNEGKSGPPQQKDAA
jgi:hypothetical protein